ncbi:hypothetical protein [Paenibacillus sp. CH40]|uniref:hypothetical protein n=1 Tax=Paenibacillus sp. CH40 TaxID=2962045 RepID=UPI0020B8CD02|nr:hypothetical protein [Paenibacillus sp. CH40]MCP3793065.1 hypothetical protein [Paenibacillus sp. CH40]
MNISLNKEANRIRNLTMFKGCVHKDSKCNGITSKAHSIQNKKYLNRISNENGEVLCIDFGKVGLSKRSKLHLVGKGKASIFTGFCNHHDREIFQPIEQNEYKVNDLEQNYLFAYRAFALAYYERHSTFGFMKEHFEIKKKRGENTEEIEKKIRFYKNHLDFIESLKNSMNNNLDNKKFGRISTEVLVWPRNYGIAATSMFFVDKDV